jgi:hypothetical protein
MNKTKQRERRAIDEPLGLQGNRCSHYTQQILCFGSIYRSHRIKGCHSWQTESKLSKVDGPSKSQFTPPHRGHSKVTCLSNPLFAKWIHKNKATGLEGLPIPLVTIKTGIKTPDGHEEILSEYLCDYPGCPQIATRMLGCVVEIGAFAVVCEEHAGQKSQ